MPTVQARRWGEASGRVARRRSTSRTRWWSAKRRRLAQLLAYVQQNGADRRAVELLLREPLPARLMEVLARL
ncbi:hypothetical protein [Paenibacillus koleovorans]|uniref:hypothetical protein n=1 Tax=Paenibacillus koleovorans TaxID=121608 RepID=UPI000FD74105|nr:hypothetical protein [Paenibacillus koleovorans]